ncbi:MAG: hypothetical protein U5J97_00425 [Trueperaceae bacterium]|nr:hypothetical protein [Trueperaceae bacterium]
MTRITRITRILAAAATIALIAGPVFAQGPRAANDAPGRRAAADATTTQAQPQTRTQLRDPASDRDATVAPVRDRVRDPAQHLAGDAMFGPRYAALAEALGMTDEELRDAIAGGATCAGLAEEAGISLGELPIGAAGFDRPSRADRPQLGAASPQGRMQQDAPQARRGGGRF